MLQFDEDFYNEMMEKLPPPEEIKQHIRETLHDSNIFRTNELKEDVKNGNYHRDMDIIDGGEFISLYLNKNDIRQFRNECDNYAHDNYNKFPEFIHRMKEILRDVLAISEKEFIQNELNYIPTISGRNSVDALLLSIWLFHKFDHILEEHEEEYVSEL